jgi:hypothetical protein
LGSYFYEPRNSINGKQMGGQVKQLAKLFANKVKGFDGRKISVRGNPSSPDE